MTPYIAYSVFMKRNLRSSVQTWSIIVYSLFKVKLFEDAIIKYAKKKQVSPRYYIIFVP